MCPSSLPQEGDINSLYFSAHPKSGLLWKGFQHHGWSLQESIGASYQSCLSGTWHRTRHGTCTLSPLPLWGVPMHRNHVRVPVPGVLIFWAELGHLCVQRDSTENSDHTWVCRPLAWGNFFCPKVEESTSAKGGTSLIIFFLLARSLKYLQIYSPCFL